MVGSQRLPVQADRAEEPRRFVYRPADGGLWVGSYVEGSLVASAAAELSGTLLHVRIDAEAVDRDPGLLPAVCDWAADHDVQRVVAEVGGEGEGGLVGAGFSRGAEYVTYSRPLDDRDARRRPPGHVREVGLRSPEVADLAASGLPPTTGAYRPSGSDVLAAADGDPTARAWVAGAPATGCIVTHVSGRAGVIALIVCLPGSSVGLSDDLLDAALSALVADGATTMRSVVESTNVPSRRLNRKYGMDEDAHGTWWHRELTG